MLFLHFVVTFYILLFTTYFLNISQGHLAHIFYSIYLFILFVCYVLQFFFQVNCFVLIRYYYLWFSGI
jgi:hypothetical protein